MIQEHATTLDQLWNRTKAYRQSEAYLETLRFVSAMREFSPYNAYLLRLQRPRLRFAATNYDWNYKFGRRVRLDDPQVHPLVVLWPFGPVEFVYDLADTDGDDLPAHILEPFYAGGRVERQWWERLLDNMTRRGIGVAFVTEDVNSAGRVVRLSTPLPAPPNRGGTKAFPPIRFMVELNNRLDRTAQFFTLLHELAHVVCGHLGALTDDDWQDRKNEPEDVVEVEAESVAFVVGSRLGLSSPSETYLVDYTGRHGEMPKGVSITTVLTASWLLEEWTAELSWPKKPQRRAAAERARQQRRAANSSGEDS